MDSYKIFKYLETHNIGLKLVIFGEKQTVPYQIKKDVNVELYGVTEHKEVLRFLANCNLYKYNKNRKFTECCLRRNFSCQRIIHL